jgi:hypothetical protein
MKSARPALGRARGGLSADRPAAPFPLDIVEWTRPHAGHADLVRVLGDFLPRATQAEIDAAARSVGRSLYWLQWKAAVLENPTLRDTRDRLGVLSAAFQNVSEALALALDDPRAAALLCKVADAETFGPDFPPKPRRPGMDPEHAPRPQAEASAARWETMAVDIARASLWAQEAQRRAESMAQGRRAVPPLEELARTIAALWDRHARRNNRGQLLRRFTASRNRSGANALLAALVGVAALSITAGAINKAVRKIEKARHK